MTWKAYLVTQALGVAAFNAVCNAGYTWFLWRGESVLAYETIGTDLALTPAWIGLLSVLLGTPFIRKALADGRMMREAGVTAHRFAHLVPHGLVQRGVAAAALCAIAFAMPLALILPLLGDGAFTLAGAVGTKVAITVAFSLVIVPLVVIAAAADTAGTAPASSKAPPRPRQA